MNLKEWAASQGIAHITARRQYAAGTLPVPTYQLGRLIMVGEPLTLVRADACWWWIRPRWTTTLCET